MTTTADIAPASPITEARIASPWVVALPNQKGGVGKTTLALALAAVTADANGRALVVDVDPQSSSAEMAGRMADPGFDFSHEMDPGTLSRLRELRNYDMVFIDCPGSLEGGQILAAVLAVADYAVIPFVNDPLSVRPTVRTARFVGEHGVPYKVLLNNVDPRLGADEVRAAWELLDAGAAGAVPLRGARLPGVPDRAGCQADRHPVPGEVRRQRPRGRQARAHRAAARPWPDRRPERA